MLGLLKMVCLMVGCLLWSVLWSAAEDEETHLVESIQEGEFDMEEQIVAQGMLDSSGEAVYQVYGDGDIAIANSLREIALSREQAYALLNVLYRHMDVLRQRKDEPPLRLLTEQEVEELAERIQETGTYAPNGSNYHDHLCSCPGCNYDGPDPTEEEIQQMMAQMGPEPKMPEWAQPE